MGLQYIPIEFFKSLSATNEWNRDPTVLIIYAFVGLKVQLSYQANLKNPDLLCLVQLLKLLFVCLFYFFIMMVYVSVVPRSEAGNVGALVSLGETLLGPSGLIIITLAPYFQLEVT